MSNDMRKFMDLAAQRYNLRENYDDDEDYTPVDPRWTQAKIEAHRNVGRNYDFPPDVSDEEWLEQNPGYDAEFRAEFERLCRERDLPTPYWGD
jgi:hypothetical protein